MVLDNKKDENEVKISSNAMSSTDSIVFYRSHGTGEYK